MSNEVFETRRKPPVMMDLMRAKYIEFPYSLDVDPQTALPELLAQRAINGAIQTQPETLHYELKLMLEGASRRLKDQLDELYYLALTQGEKVEFLDDPSKLFHLASIEGFCVRSGKRPSGTWSKAYYLYPYLGGSHGIGIFGASQNYVKNGDAIDGTTDWTVAFASIQLSSQFHLIPGGKTNRVFRIQSSDGSGTTSHIYQDCEMSGLLHTLGFVTLSLMFRADSVGAALTPSFVVKVKAADGSGSTVTVGTYTANAHWAHLNIPIALDAGTIGTVTDATLRLMIEVDGSIRMAPLYLTFIQLEEQPYATGFMARAGTGSTRTAAGLRSTPESMRFLNMLYYAVQMRKYTLGSSEPFQFTVATWYFPLWDAGASGTPFGNMYLFSMGQPDTSTNEMAGMFFTNIGVLEARVLPQSGYSFNTITSPQTVGIGSYFHIAMSWKDWDGINANSGRLDLYVDGVLDQTTTHSLYASGAGTFLYIGSDPDGTYLANGYFHNFMVDAAYIDGTAVTIADFYNADEPPPRERTSWRCVMKPGQGLPCILKNNAYQLDLKLTETA